jgi:hypothetical protein
MWPIRYDSAISGKRLKGRNLNQQLELFNIEAFTQSLVGQKSSKESPRMRPRRVSSRFQPIKDSI